MRERERQGELDSCRGLFLTLMRRKISNKGETFKNKNAMKLIKLKQWNAELKTLNSRAGLMSSSPKLRCFFPYIISCILECNHSFEFTETRNSWSNSCWDGKLTPSWGVFNIWTFIGKSDLCCYFFFFLIEYISDVFMLLNKWPIFTHWLPILHRYPPGMKCL